MSTPAGGHQQPQFQPGQGQPGQYQQPYGGYGYPPQQPQKKKGGCFKIGCIGLAVLVALIVVIAIIVAAVSGGGDEEDSGNDGGDSSAAQSEGSGEEDAAADGQASQDIADEAAPAGAGITLEGTASGAANVSYGPGGSISTADIGSTGTWSATITDAENTDLYSVTVMDSTGADDAEVSCKITTDGEVQAEESATGGFAIATCTQPIF